MTVHSLPISLLKRDQLDTATFMAMLPCILKVGDLPSGPSLHCGVLVVPHWVQALRLGGGARKGLADLL